MGRDFIYHKEKNKYSTLLVIVTTLTTNLRYNHRLLPHLFGSTALAN